MKSNSTLSGLMKNSFLKGLIIIVLNVAFIFYLCMQSQHTLAASFSGTTLNYYILVGLFILSAYYAIKDKKVFVIYISMLFLFFTWYVFANPHYSSVDESANFINIEQIRNNNKLYTYWDPIDIEALNEVNHGIDQTNNFDTYEAVQAPLYYFVFALVGKVIPSVYVRFRVYRLLGLYSVLLVYLFVGKTVDLLRSKFDIDDEIYRLALLLTIFCPGYLMRASRINNEILVCVLISILMYEAVKCIMNGYSAKSYWVISFLSIGCFMTKSTAIYAYVVIGILAIMQKRIKNAILPVLVSALPSIPWFIFNLKNYGRLTGLQYHLDTVVPMVNPLKKNVDLVNTVAADLIGTFYTGQEFGLAIAEILLLGVVAVLAIVTTVYVAIETCRVVVEKKWQLDESDLKTKINIVCLSLLIACLLCLLAGTLSTKISCLIGRYFYPVSVALILISVFNKDELFENKFRNYFQIILVIFIGSVIVRGANTFINKVYTENKLYASKVSQIELYDYTDNNCIHGYNELFNYVIVKVDDNKYKENYKSLIGREVIGNNQTSVITEISDIEDMDGVRVIWLYIEEHMENLTEGNMLKLGGYR